MVSAMKALTDYFNNMYGNLQDLQNDLNMEIKQTVDEINSIAEKIAILNKQINTVEMSGTIAKELRDQRELLVDQLSLLVDTQVDEYPIHDVNDPTRLTGATQYIVGINGNQILVFGNDYNKLVAVARQPDEKVNQTDINGLFDVKWSNGNDFGLHSASMSGRLRGLMEMRDGNNTFYFHGTTSQRGVEDYSKPGSGNPLEPTTTVTIKPADISLLDMKLCNLTYPEGRILVAGQYFYYQGWEFDGTEFKFFLDEAKNETAFTEANLGKDASIGHSVDFQGIPYYMTQMNAWLRGFVEKINGIFHGDYSTDPASTADGYVLTDLTDDYGNTLYFRANGFDANGEVGSIVFTGNKNNTANIYPADQYSAIDLLGGLGYGNGLYELTAGNITIVEELMRNADRLGHKSESTIGIEQCKQVELAIELLNSKEMFSYRNGTAKDFLEMMLGDIALKASNANTFFNTYKGLSVSIDNQRNSISGVDEDEEAVNMVKYQYAYNLSSRMIQTLTQIYDRLILQTGV
jgi:flagellar hook-associated protein 1 FlgK